jgi:excisionase family DNA binding protein
MPQLYRGGNEMLTDQLTVSVPEAARLLGIGMRSLYRAIREGRLPAIRVGRKPKLRIPCQAIDRLLSDPESWQRGVGK